MIAPSQSTCRLLLLGGAVFTYFVLFPGDFPALLRPLATVLELSRAVSPWLYGLAGVCVVAWTIIQVWGQPRRA